MELTSQAQLTLTAPAVSEQPTLQQELTQADAVKQVTHMSGTALRLRSSRSK